MEKISVKEATKILAVGKTTLYKYLSKLQIKPVKKGGRSYYKTVDIMLIQKEIDKTNQELEHPEQEKEIPPKGEHVEHPERTTEQGVNIGIIREIYENQIQSLKSELKKERENCSQLTLLLGQSQKEAEITKQELLKLQTINTPPSTPPKKKRNFFSWFSWSKKHPQ